MTNPQLDRPKLTRAILEAHNIYYNENVYKIGSPTSEESMPSHVNNLRKALVDLSAIRIHENWKLLFQEEDKMLQEPRKSRNTFMGDLDFKPPPTAYFEEGDLRLSRSDWRDELDRLEDNIYFSKSIAREARTLDYDSDIGWMDFLRRNFFQRYQGPNRENDDNFPRFDDFALEGNVLWDESERAFSWVENFTPGIRERTGPKPDLSYGFVATQVNKNAEGFESMNLFRNLSFEVLGKLRERAPAIRSTVTSGLSKWQNWRADQKGGTAENNFSGRLLTPDFLCFPWAIVEAKHAQSKMSAEEYCQCQLANATACAYDLQEKLVKAVDHSGLVDPIIGFTCIGLRVRLWLTYQGNDCKIRMVCIWATTLDGTWGVLALSQIVQNMQLWASRILRGKLVQYIDWAHRGVLLRTSSMATQAGTSSRVPVEQIDKTSKGGTRRNAASRTENNESQESLAKAARLAMLKRKIRVRIPLAPDSRKTTSEAKAQRAQILAPDLMEPESSQSTSEPASQSLRSSRSESDLKDKGGPFASKSAYTIFDRLAGKQRPGTTSSLEELPAEQTGLPQSVLYPVLSVYSRSVSSDAGKRDSSASFGIRAVSESRVIGDVAMN